MTISEHEVLTFERVKHELEDLKTGITVESTGPLAEALGQLSCFPYVKVLCDKYYSTEKFSIAGKPAGTFLEPDVDLILQESTVSSFGRGETTVLDPTYRNGKEISGQNTDIITSKSHFCGSSAIEISNAMFVGKSVELKFYKLAVYEEGGHFDWHMDSTHSDQHHATLLLALNTSWEGGDLKLRRNGVETLVDMHPEADKDSSMNLQAVAFYTDTEHKVEPVTKGIRVILQYDVEVGPRVLDPYYDETETLLDEIENHSANRKSYQESSESLTGDKEIVKKITDIIEGLFVDGEKEVAFAMQYLYRKSSILPEFLKGTDAQLYKVLAGRFDVTLRPVVLHSGSDYNGRFETPQATIWDEDKRDSDATRLHLPMVSAIKQISCKEYMEHTGNESQDGELRYFGGGMFVRQKEVAEKH